MHNHAVVVGIKMVSHLTTYTHTYITYFLMHFKLTHIRIINCTQSHSETHSHTDTFEN